VLSSALGPNPELFELSALISDRGAPRQPLHPDTGYSNGTAIVTAFVALQDVTVEMGPTFFLAGSHSQAAHEAFNGEPGVKAELLRTSPRRLGTVGVGDATVFDSRVLHGGGANDKGRRILFYFSFKVRHGHPARTEGSTLCLRRRSPHAPALCLLQPHPTPLLRELPSRAPLFRLGPRAPTVPSPFPA
jgi:ectoine hydroxylase-related dioxygenase (phytanoyl-CoA dioxygenase family)